MVRWCIRLTRLTLVCEVIRYRLVQVRQNQKKTFRVGGPQSPFSISSSFILSFVLLPFFLNTKNIFPSVSWCSAYTCITSCQQSLSHGCVPARKHCRSAYLCCLPSTTGRGHVSARKLGRTGAAPTGTASSGQPSPAVYLHTY